MLFSFVSDPCVLNFPRQYLHIDSQIFTSGKELIHASNWSVNELGILNGSFSYCILLS